MAIKEVRPDEHRYGKGKPPRREKGNEGRNKGKNQKDKNQDGNKEKGNRKDQDPDKKGGNKKQPARPRNDGGGGSSSGEGGGGGSQGQNQQNRKDGQGQNQQNQKEDGSGGKPNEEWKPSQDSSNQGQGKQMALMIIASPVDPVYAADSYWNEFDPDEGLRPNPEYFYNMVGARRMMETWKNTLPNNDKKRKEHEIFFLSALKIRFMPYRPASMEPTRFQLKYKPLNYSYRVKARLSHSTPKDWKEIKGLSPEEKRKFKKYLKVNLRPEAREVFARRLREATRGRPGYFARAEGILKSMSRYRYKVGFDEDTSIAKLTKFMRDGKNGDCTEFSHTSVIMARMSGIPARVVTGFLAARALQRDQHRKGLAILRKQIKPLQKYKPEHLYLITNAHRHAWAQFYMPGYGWLDFETTSEAKPPKPQFNMNNRGVVIPEIKTEKETPKPGRPRPFPWKAVAWALAIIAALVIVLLYLYRYFRELYLFIRSRGSSPRAIEAHYRWTLMRLASRGYPLMKQSETPLEYARRVPGFESLADEYTMLRYREIYPPGERGRVWNELKKGCANFLRKARRGGLLFWPLRFFNLRGLYY